MPENLMRDKRALVIPRSAIRSFSLLVEILHFVYVNVSAVSEDIKVEN